jgi:3-hydroxymyristoyl/3-hydroxydecanoyl-(acyl carrier protein) dehydratase
MTGWQTRELFIPDDHPSAAGHFPGDPIIPGALLLDAAVAAIAGAAGDGGVIVRAAKFLRPVRHGTHLTLRWLRLNDGLFRFECRFAEEVALTGTLEWTGGAV